MRVAVAGATGHAGRGIVRALAARGARIRALVRNPDGLAEVRGLCDETAIVQVTDAKTLSGVLDDADYLVSAVGKTWQKDKTPRWTVDVGANINLFQEAKRAGIRRIGFISVAGASLDHPVLMMRMKGEAEAALKATGIPSVIIQPSGYFSDMWEVFEMCRKGTCYCIGDGLLPLNPISTEDLGEYTADCLLDDAKVGHRLPVGGPEVFTQIDLARVSERILGKKVRIVRIPVWVAKAAVAAIKPFNRNLWELADFFVGSVAYGQKHGGTILPGHGDRRLEDYFRGRYAASLDGARG
jgi:uncharacterized protein YbjT (DUF2867 family)